MEVVGDIEDIGVNRHTKPAHPVAHSSKRKRGNSPLSHQPVATSWRNVLGPPPPIATTKV